MFHVKHFWLLLLFMSCAHEPKIPDIHLGPLVDLKDRMTNKLGTKIKEKITETVVVQSFRAKRMTASEEWLGAHNQVRYRKGLPPVSWSKEVENFSREYLTEKAHEGCQMVHSTGSGYGENLAMSFGSKEPKTPTQVVGWWANEEQHYDYASDRCKNGKQCGHYTQIVWRTSTEIGCSTVRCPNTDRPTYLYSCNYNPPGNYIGRRPY